MKLNERDKRGEFLPPGWLLAHVLVRGIANKRSQASERNELPESPPPPPPPPILLRLSGVGSEVSTNEREWKYALRFVALT